MPRKKNDFDFETAVTELEALVEQMESGELTLEETLKQFERGVALTRACQKALKQAEQKVELLTGGKDGTLAELPAADIDGD